MTDREEVWAEAERKAREKYLEDGARVDMSTLRGAGFFSRRLYFSDFAHRIFIWQSLVREAELVQRKLTAAEVEALSQHSDQLWRTRAMAQPLSLVLAAFMTFRGRAVLRFPFVKAPMKWLNPNVFPSQRFPLAQGAKARAYWHTVRFLAYSPPSWLVTTWCTYEWALGAFENRKRNDPRLKDLTQQVLAIRKAELAKRFPNAVRGQQQQQAGGAQQGKPGQPIQSSRQHQQTEDRDDASPTSTSDSSAETWGNAGTYQETSYSSPSASPSSLPPATSSSSPQTSSRPSYSPPPASQAPQQETGWGTSSSAYDNDDLDDMSPIAPAARRAEAADASASVPAGSAWDRVRQQGRVPSQQPQRQQQQQQQQQQQPDNTAQWGGNNSNDTSGSSSGNGNAQAGTGGWSGIRSRNGPTDTESYTYSAADEERERRMYDKEKAQKEFDAMIERERKGQGASGGGGSNSGGRAW